jgi:hypothetical protein
VSVCNCVRVQLEPVIVACWHLGPCLVLAPTTYPACCFCMQLHLHLGITPNLCLTHIFLILNLPPALQPSPLAPLLAEPPVWALTANQVCAAVAQTIQIANPDLDC